MATSRSQTDTPRKVLMGLLLLALPLLVTGARGDPATPVNPAPVLVLEAVADLEAGVIDIHGDGFGALGNAVTLGYYQLPVVRACDAHITARLPQTLWPGNYVLTVGRPEIPLKSDDRSVGSLVVAIGFQEPDPGAFHLQRTQSAEYDGLKVQFLEVVEDSRCPSDATCIWAGRIVIAIRIWYLGQDLGEHHLTLGEGSAPAQIVVAKHLVRLDRALPVPRADFMPLEPADYCIMLPVTRDYVLPCTDGTRCLSGK